MKRYIQHTYCDFCGKEILELPKKKGKILSKNGREVEVEISFRLSKGDTSLDSCLECMEKLLEEKGMEEDGK